MIQKDRISGASRGSHIALKREPRQPGCFVIGPLKKHSENACSQQQFNSELE